jgi:radical SAM protein with 4Fe4S-binding SPASM domain
MNEVMCSLPFNSISIDPSGNLRQCCNSDKGVFVENVKRISVDEIINNKSIKNIRKSLLQNIKDPMCARCWRMEEIGNKSFRDIANENPDFGMEHLLPTDLKENIGYENLRYIDITLGNKCNLACRMCHPGSSSLIAKQYIELQYPMHNAEIIEFDRTSRDKLLELIRLAPNLASIYLLGGEPLINDFHDEILDLLIELDRDKNITIHYSTNLHSDIEKHLKRWKHFKLIETSVSIDGSDETYEYVRWPGSWKKVYNNLKQVCELADNDNNNLRPGVAITAQNLNVGNMPTLIEKLQEISKDISFYFIPVTGCNYIDMTPESVLRDTIEKLIPMYDPHDRIKELINYYKTALVTRPSVDKRKVVEFFKKQKDFDRLRKQNLFKSVPYFLDLAKEYDIEVW